MGREEERAAPAWMDGERRGRAWGGARGAQGKEEGIRGGET
jgi:hypothetical protein